MSRKSVAMLMQHNKVQLTRLAYLQEYSRKTDDPRIKQALGQIIEDIEEGLARTASRLRRLDQSPGLADQDIDQKLLRQARTRRGQASQLHFVRQGLTFQLEWYEARQKELRDDADTQAIFAALAEQTRMRLHRWEILMKELKVLPE